MKHNCFDLFPIPLFNTNIDTTGVVKLFNNKIKSKGVDNKQCISLLHYHNTENVFDLYKELEPLHQRILDASNFYYKNVLNHHQSGDLKVTNAWFNLCQLGGYQQKHSHANSIISGTLYLSVDANTNITFCSPYNVSNNVSNVMSDEPDYNTPNEFNYHYHYGTVTLGASPGDLLLWPSYLNHGYDNNRTPNRLTLSFNMIPSYFNNDYKLV